MLNQRPKPEKGPIFDHILELPAPNIRSDCRLAHCELLLSYEPSKPILYTR